MRSSGHVNNTRGDKPRIILIDDDGKFLEMLSELVEHAGFFCDAVCDSGEAVEKISRENFDIIVTDMTMPGLSGLELIDSVKGKSSDSLIIVVTGNRERRIEKEAIAHGADLFFRKPLNLAGFLKVIEQYNPLQGKEMR